jgi:hypothetical protein
MGIGVASWFRSDGPSSVEQVAYTYADQAVRMVSASNGSPVRPPDGHRGD